jgi:cysteine synthase
VLATDVVLAVSDRATDRLGLLFGTEQGKGHLRRRGVADEIIDGLPSLGLSSICNVLGAIKTAKYLDLGSDDVVVTVATDGAAMYGSERELALRRNFPDGFDEIEASEVYGEHLLGAATDHLLELGRRDRERIFNLGYYTWVEQQGVSLADFEARRDPAFWERIREVVPVWDDLIDDVNASTGVLEQS